MTNFRNSTNYTVLFEKLVSGEFVFESTYPSSMNITACEAIARSRTQDKLEFQPAFNGETKWQAFRAHTDTHRYTIFNYEDADYIKSITKREGGASSD